MTNPQSLSDRVEAATGPDRELDALIWLAVTPGATRNELRYTHKATGKDCVIDETRDASCRLIIVPAYTASMDAVRTLIPPGSHWRVENHPEYGISAIVDDIQGFVECPIRALLSASLRARGL